MPAHHSLLPIQVGSDACLRLVCLPYAGGGAAAFHRWRPFFPPEIELVPLRLPGREDRFSDQPYTNLLKLAKDGCDAISSINDRPIALLGYSMGAYVVLEIAREIRRRNLRNPELLVVAASRAPHLAKTRPHSGDLPDDQFVAEIVRHYEGVPPAILEQRELLSLLLPTLRADIKMLEEYEPHDEPPLEMEILALGGAEDRGVSIADLQAWKNYTTARCSTRLFPGGHFFLFRDQEPGPGTAIPIGLQIVVDRLRKVLEEQ